MREMIHISSANIQQLVPSLAVRINSSNTSLCHCICPAQHSITKSPPCKANCNTENIQKNPQVTLGTMKVSQAVPARHKTTPLKAGCSQKSESI